MDRRTGVGKGAPGAGRVSARRAPEDTATLRAILHLRALPGIGDLRIAELIDRYGTPAAALDAPASELGREAAAAKEAPAILGRVERSLQVIERLGVDVLVRGGPGYPARLEQLHDPPYILFCRGRLEFLDRPAVAVVGARRHTEYGAEATAILASGLARAGVVVVSGLARGIDALAHEAALESGTIGVLGSGIDVAYPRGNTRLIERVARDGLVLSEFLPGEPAFRHNFPRRNRIIAALALGVIVVEAAPRSGSLITVNHALDLGREVFAVPGPITRETSAAPNALIRDGARLVTCAEDVLEELGYPGVAAEGVRGGTGRAIETGPPAPPPELTGEQLALWEALSDEPRHVDVLAEACGLSAATATAGLLALELSGHARQLAGARYVRVTR